jgi:threonine/homoserine/homoserine lactone efflux protein
MDFTFLFRGVIIGLSIAAPVGPIGILCIKRTLNSGRIVGLASGLGAATADAFYGFVAAFGLTFISSFLVNQRNWLQLVGGLFLCFLGVRTFISQPPENSLQPEQADIWRAYVSTLFLTLTNPLTILSFAAIFAGLGLANQQGNLTGSVLTVLGVFLGSTTWWVFLSGITSLVRGRLTLSAFRWVNRLSGVVIFGFGVAAIIDLVVRYF